MERKKIKLSISETANVIKPTVSEKNGEIHASPTFHNAYLLIKNHVQKLPIIDCHAISGHVVVSSYARFSPVFVHVFQNVVTIINLIT